jgi:hypothetical protein
LAEAQSLSIKLHTFQGVFAAEPVYAHGVMAGIYFRVHKLGDGLNESSGEGKIGSGRYWLIDRQNEVAGIELAWNTVFSAAVKNKTTGVDDRVQKGFAEVNRLLGVASFDQLDVPGIRDHVADAGRCDIGRGSGPRLETAEARRRRGLTGMRRHRALRLC